MTPITYSKAFSEGVREEMERDPTIFIMGTDLLARGGNFAQLVGIGAEFGPERVRDTPISEAAMVAAGVGAAVGGMRPIVDLNFLDFALGAMDEIVNQAAKMRYMLRVPVPLVIRASYGVTLYAMQHNNSIETWFAHTPGLIVVTPATPADAKGLIKSALRGEDPVIFLMHKRLGGSRGEVGGREDLVAIGEARIARPGRDVTVVTYGGMLPPSLKLATRLAEEGVDVEVIDLRSVMPLDLDLIESSVRRTGRVVVVGEAPRFLGIGAEISASIAESLFHVLRAPVVRVGAAHSPIPHSPALFATLVPGEADIERAVRLALGSGGASAGGSAEAGAADEAAVAADRLGADPAAVAAEKGA
jgi:pyruvate dehydrogenase E1 component beta subunit